jgi:hypothetical protein
MQIQFPASMPEETFRYRDPAPHTFYDVPDNSARRVLVDSVRRSLTSIKTRSANKFNDQTRELLQQFADAMEPEDKEVIEAQLDESV